MADPQGIDKFGQRLLFAPFNGIEDILGGLIRHPIQGNEVLFGKAIEVGYNLYHPLVHQLSHQLIPQPIDIHGAL